MKPTVQRHFATSEELLASVRARTDTVLLSFSRGKDAIASWLALRDAGLKVIPYHLDLVPGLGFVDRSIADFERVFATPILRVTDPSFYRLLRNLVFQPPERARAIELAALPSVTYEDTEALLRHRHGRHPIAIGTRAADSPTRRANINMHGAVNPRRDTLLPVFDWNVARVRARIAAAGISLPVDYEMFGRSFDGIDYRFLGSLRERFPEDYAVVLRWFPLASLELTRRSLCPVPAQHQKQ